MFPRRTTAAALALVAMLAFVACQAAPADTPDRPAGPYDAPAGAVLGTPVPEDRVEDNHILQVLLANIEHTPKGALIRIVARSLSLMPVATALIEAHDRGVRVQALADRGVSHDYQAVGRLTDALGSDRSADSFLYLVEGSRGGDTEQHHKSWSFSRTGRSRHVVMVGSTNLSYASMGQYNDMYSFVGRRDVWRRFGRIFAEQVRDRPIADPAVSVRLGHDHAWFYPGYDLRTDPVRRYLAALPTTGLRIRIAMLAWHGVRGDLIARMLAAKARAGASVEAVVTVLGDSTRRILRDAGIRVLSGRFDHGYEVHHKLVLAAWDGPHGRERRILTGSDNFGGPALDREEVVLAIHAAQDRTWRAYQSHYDALLKSATEATD